MDFGDLKSKDGLRSLNDYLSTRSYIVGYGSTQADLIVLEGLGATPTEKEFHVLRWYKHIKSFANNKNRFGNINTTITVNGSSFPDPAKSQPAKSSANDDDDVDLFASDDEDAEAQKLKDERLKAYAEKKAKKPGPIAKSSVILDVKPWEDTTNMKLMETNVRSISCDGLVWGAAKLVPVGYGINKLQIMCVVEDEKVSIDWLQEEIEKFEDVVQSVDIAAFNKI